MNRIQVPPLFVALVVLLAILLLRPLSGSVPAQAQAPPGAVGRYGIASSRGLIYLIDTGTGKIWFGVPPDPDGKLEYRWEEINTPFRPKP